MKHKVDVFKTREELKLLNKKEVDDFCFNHAHNLGHVITGHKRPVINGSINGMFSCSCGAYIKCDWR